LLKGTAFTAVGNGIEIRAGYIMDKSTKIYSYATLLDIDFLDVGQML
jgi:hypothetical protein